MKIMKIICVKIMCNSNNNEKVIMAMSVCSINNSQYIMCEVMWKIMKMKSNV